MSLFLPQLYGAAAPKRFVIALDYVIVIKNFLNPEGRHKLINCSRVKPILLKGWIFPIGWVASGRVCACSLRTRLVFLTPSFIWKHIMVSCKVSKLAFIISLFSKQATVDLPDSVWTTANWINHRYCVKIYTKKYIYWFINFRSKGLVVPICVFYHFFYAS